MRTDQTTGRLADIETARRQLLELGDDPSGQVADVIARSWLRCVERLDAGAQPPIEVAERPELEIRREAQGQLRRAAGPELDALAELVYDSQSMVLLADTDGLILDAVGNTDFVHKAARVALQPGAMWSEAHRGTNAIGTALIERRAVEVLGREHYLECNGILSCHAAPILTTRGEPCGVMDVSGDSRLSNLHALGMVRMAIQIVEHRLACDAPDDCCLLRFHRRPELLGTHREAVLVLRDGNIVGANRAALQLLQANWRELLDSPPERWLEPTGKIAQSLFHTLDGSLVHASARADAPPRRRRVQRERPAPGEEFVADPGTDEQLAQAAAVLDAGISVLISGETGVGKEVFARRLHARSRRCDGPFVAINCAAMPETLIESELFGYEDGAFTGARRKGMPGRIREADGGVLFLDEIGDMPLALQARLLRVLQERSVSPLGCGAPVAVDFDLVCATNRDLQQLVAAERFRADLYYRIQDFKVQLPALRERMDRERLIRELFAHFDTGRRRLAPATLQRLCAYAWPGNLRQLVSTLRTLLALTPPGQTIESEQLPAELQATASGGALEMQTADCDLRTLGREAIERALQASDGCVSAAARQLGIHRSTLYRQLKRLGH
ncbi:MAG: sigma-54-dependent Fis family transcriptional regulator [Acidihalobacter sp.]|uniref:sigma-54-dependent Fis family transcriptional regulator n=1 Tax=Acidihalobacter sp. TaxID=1872108 RepID=UPI00307F6623